MSNKPKSFRILKFQSSNIKKLKVVQIDPKGNVIKISGANGSGKTSVLDCIEYALMGTDNVPSKVIHQGQRQGVIQLDLGEVVVTRKFLESGRTDLQVMSKADRSVYPTPQALLDALGAKHSFDPLEFSRMKASDQSKVLRNLLDIDFDAFDAAYKRDYELRRDIKKEYLAIEARRDVIVVQPDLPPERRDEESLTKEMASASQFNEAIDQERMRRENVQRNVREIGDRSEQRQIRLQEMEEEVKRLKEAQKQDLDLAQSIEKEVAAWKPLAKPKNVRDLADQLNAARIVNQAIAKREQRDALQAEVDALKLRHQALDESVEKIREARTQAIANAHFPIEGLGFGEDEVLWQGLPFNQISNADQIRVSVAIGMAMNPRLRVMRVKDGSLLDSNSMAIIEELAKTEDFQLWMEVVDETGKVGIFLEDGEVKTVNDESDVPDEPERDMRISLPMPPMKTVEELDPPPPVRRTRTRRAKP